MPRLKPRFTAKELYWAASRFQDRAIYQTNFGLLAPLLFALRWEYPSLRPDKDGYVRISAEEINRLKKAQKQVEDGIREYEAGTPLDQALELACGQGIVKAHSQAEKDIEHAFRTSVVATLQRNFGMGRKAAIKEAVEIVGVEERTIERSINKVIQALDAGDLSLDMPDEDAHEASMRVGLIPKPAEVLK